MVLEPLSQMKGNLNSCVNEVKLLRCCDMFAIIQLANEMYFKHFRFAMGSEIVSVDQMNVSLGVSRVCSLTKSP